MKGRNKKKKCVYIFSTIEKTLMSLCKHEAPAAIMTLPAFIRIDRVLVYAQDSRYMGANGMWASTTIWAVGFWAELVRVNMSFKKRDYNYSLYEKLAPPLFKGYTTSKTSGAAGHDGAICFGGKWGLGIIFGEAVIIIWPMLFFLSFVYCWPGKCGVRVCVLFHSFFTFCRREKYDGEWSL